eukprot:591720_1
MASEKSILHIQVQKVDALDITFADIHSVLNWKEIRNCPGRYVLKKKVGAELSCIAFIQKALQKVHDENDSNGNTNINNGHLLTLHETFGLKQDEMSLLFFKDGGGIITYKKQNIHSDKQQDSN